MKIGCSSKAADASASGLSTYLSQINNIKEDLIMAFCGKCGTQINNGIKFCPACGTSVDSVESIEGNINPQSTTAQPANQQSTYSQPKVFQKMDNGEDTTSEYDPRDIAANKGMAVLSYFGILVLIPWFSAPKSKFARFHAKQGINLLIVDALYFLLSIILNSIKITHTGYLVGIPYEVKTTPWFISLLLFLISIPIVILAILGIVNAVKGRVQELPVIGKLKFIK